MKLRIVFIIVTVFYVFGCTTTIYLGIPDEFRGHYRSKELILGGRNYLYFRVHSGGVTVYFGGQQDSNIKDLDYESISAYYIINSDYTYSFETGSIVGKIVFSSSREATISFFKHTYPTFKVEDIECEKMNDF